MKISVLDQSLIREGVSPDISIRESMEMARHCEALGYYRYWLSEHHSSGAVAGSAPEVLMAAIAATTTRIRVGSAGIMLPHYSALKVAEQFRVLEAIAPGRIDLGVGRAPGSDGRTAFALNPNAAGAADAFPTMLRDLMAWSSGQALPPEHPFRLVHAAPAGPFAPEIWVLGSSNFGAQVAAWFGLPYCFAYFFADGAGAREALDIYRETFRPSAKYPTPHAAITLWALAAESEAEAEYHYQSRTISMMMMRERGQFVPLLTPEAAASFTVSDAERAAIARMRERALVGTAGDVAARIRALAKQLGVQELAIATAVYDTAARLDSYSLLARELQVAPLSLAA